MVLFIFLLTLGVGSVLSQCPEDFERHGTNCYKPMFIRTNWIEALRYCRTIGAYLITIKSADEQRSVEGIIARYHGSFDIPRFWIAGGDMFSENEYHWYMEAGNSEMITGYTNYDTNQPDNYRGHEHCLSIEFNGHTARWNDKNCNEVKYFLCQAKMETPSTVIGKK
ncbi:hypothetical protein ACF0H5_018114 [Mactra antiquata]